MANRYSRVDHRLFASVLRSAKQLIHDGDPGWSATDVLRDISNAIAYEFEKDGKEKFDRKKFFAQAGVNDPKND